MPLTKPFVPEVLCTLVDALELLAASIIDAGPGLLEKSGCWLFVGILKSSILEVIVMVSLPNQILLVARVLGSNASIFAIFSDENGASLTEKAG